MVGLIGLGRMGQSIAARLLYGGFDVIGYDKYPPQELDTNIPGESRSKQAHFIQATSIEELAHKATLIWLMVPAGKPVDDVIQEIHPHIVQKDKEQRAVIVDGGNSFFKDSLRRFAFLKQQGIEFVDCGTSGGLHGRMHGFCLMVGGTHESYIKCEPVLRALAAKNGHAHVGPAGAGHYVKMVHNGIEYALLQAYAEGFQILKEGHYKNLDLANIADLWNHGSIIRSWILTLTEEIFQQNQELEHVVGTIQESGTGLWTVEEAKEQAIPVPVIEQALHIRAESRRTGGTYATKLVSLLRQAFGGHAVTFVSDKMQATRKPDNE